MTVENGDSAHNSGWAATRLKGKAHFVLSRGVLGWGIPMYVFMGVIPALNHRVDATPFYFVWQAGLWAAGGALFGLIMWHFSERRFLKAKRLGS